MSVPAQSITLSMFWPLLLFAAENDTTTSERAADRVAARDGASGEIDVDAVAEELAREHFPTGAVGNVGWDGADVNAAWWVDDELHESFLEVSAAIEEVTIGNLSPADPAHVAMVARVIAISLGLAVYVESPLVRVEMDEEWSEEPDGPLQRGYVVRLDRSRPGGAGPVATGQFFPYAEGQTAETVDYGKALFAWFLVRHAEIMAHFEARETDLPGAVPNPGPMAT